MKLVHRSGLNGSRVACIVKSRIEFYLNEMRFIHPARACETGMIASLFFISSSMI